MRQLNSRFSTIRAARRSPSASDDMEMFHGMGEKMVYTYPTSFKHDIYINGGIDEPAKYTEVFHTIRNAGELDVIIFHINSFGGHLDSALQFIRCIQESSATVVASIEGVCHSAATFIFLSADVFEVSAGSSMLLHDYSSMNGPEKGSEQYRRIMHEKPYFDGFLNEIYADFLTPAEIDSVTNGHDIWLGDEDIIQRCEVLAEKRMQEASQPDGNEEPEQSFSAAPPNEEVAPVAEKV